MIYIVLNAQAIVMAAIAGLMFGVAGHALAGRRRSTTGTAVVTRFTAVVAQAWLCAILAGALILAPAKGSVWTMTLGSAFVIWIGFVAPALIASYRVHAIAWRSALFDCALWLGTMLVQAVVLRVIGLAAPPG